MRSESIDGELSFAACNALSPSKISVALTVMVKLLIFTVPTLGVRVIVVGCSTVDMTCYAGHTFTSKPGFDIIDLLAESRPLPDSDSNRTTSMHMLDLAVNSQICTP